MFDVGYVSAGTVLVADSPSYPGAAVVTEAGAIRLSNGEEFASPSLAAKRHVELAGGAGQRNGWTFWRLGEAGPLLDALRSDYLRSKLNGSASDTKSFRATFWDGFYEYCADNPAFMEAFPYTGGREKNTDVWASFGIGRRGYHLDAQVWVMYNAVGADIYFSQCEKYRPLYAKRNAITEELNPHCDEIIWSDPEDESSRSRKLIIKQEVDLSQADFSEIYEWLLRRLLQLRSIALGLED